MNQVYTDASGNIRQEQQSSSARAALELRGPMLPCALRDLTCAMVNLMLLDKYKQDQVGSIIQPHVDDESDAGTSSHQFAMFLQAHEGECSILTPKSTGSSSSFHFNGSNVPLLPKQGDRIGASAAWRECRHGDFISVLVWDISRESVVSFNPLSAKS